MDHTGALEKSLVNYQGRRNLYGVFRIPWSINMLGEERYQRFLAVAGGEEDFVPALVEFDETLSTALQRDLRRVELMLRKRL